MHTPGLMAGKKDKAIVHAHLTPTTGEAMSCGEKEPSTTVRFSEVRFLQESARVEVVCL